MLLCNLPNQPIPHLLVLSLKKPHINLTNMNLYKLTILSILTLDILLKLRKLNNNSVLFNPLLTLKPPSQTPNPVIQRTMNCMVERNPKSRNLLQNSSSKSHLIMIQPLHNYKSKQNPLMYRSRFLLLRRK